jgi:UDP-N-acetylglucosamine--N-acetylmuramyl-(pentapeptide) pyrophosphoryl-undecaprenol N-acetylglucosamine transferase
MPQSDLSPERLSLWLQSTNREQLLEMSKKAQTLAKPFATARVAEICKEVSHA